MATPPRITHSELDATVRLIAARRRKVDDRNLERLGTEPRDVLDYLRKYSGPDIPRWVRQADVNDGLLLHTWLWWEDRRRELALLRSGTQLGLFLTQLGAPLGIKGRQGVRDRIDRLEALLRYDRPDEQLTREARRVAAAAERNGDTRQAWVDNHRDQLRDVARRLVAAADRHLDEDDDREMLDELAYDLDRDSWTPASLSVLNLASLEVRTAPAVLELTTTHNVHRALVAADELRAAFARLDEKKQVASGHG